MSTGDDLGPATGFAPRTTRVNSDGVELAVLEAGDRAQPAVMLVHGYPDTKELWEHVLPRLAPRFHVIAYDVRGAGESGAPRGPAAYDFRKLGRDLMAVREAVAPGRRIHLVGHDWGGIAGWEFVTRPGFEEVIDSFTTIAGPSIDQVVLGNQFLLRRGRWIRAMGRARRSWYVLALWTPGLPTLIWRVLLGGGRWRWLAGRVERISSTGERPTLSRDGARGANLYRRNIPPRLLRPRRGARAKVPVQLVVPSGDRFISSSYYDQVEQHAPLVVRRLVAGSHWVPRTRPELLSRWIEEFVGQVEAGGPMQARAPWIRGGGVDQVAGRLALVTGAGSGIGRSIAKALASRGASVLLLDVDSEAVARTAAGIPGARSLVCDVGDGEAMERLAVQVLEEHGTPQIVVNNAGIGVAGPFVYTGLDDWRRVLDVNLMGVVHGCLMFARAMIVSGLGGQIINVASASSYAPTKALPAYSTSKAAVLMLSECLRAEFDPWGIGVTAVCPGFIATNIIQSTRYVGPASQRREEIADSITKGYERRGYSPDRVATAVVEAIGSNQALVPITPEAKVMLALARFAPGLMRRLARLDPLPG